MGSELNLNLKAFFKNKLQEKLPTSVGNVLSYNICASYFQTPTSAITTDASGCSVITYTCERTPNVETDIVLITVSYYRIFGALRLKNSTLKIIWVLV